MNAYWHKDCICTINTYGSVGQPARVQICLQICLSADPGVASSILTRSQIDLFTISKAPYYHNVAFHQSLCCLVDAHPTFYLGGGPLVSSVPLIFPSLPCDMQGLRETTVCTQARFLNVSSVPLIFPSLPCDMSINQLLWILVLFLRLPIVFNLDTIELFYGDCRLLVTFENSLDQDQVTLLCVCMCVCVSVCLSVRVRAFACLHIGAD